MNWTDDIEMGSDDSPVGPRGWIRSVPEKYPMIIFIIELSCCFFAKTSHSSIILYNLLSFYILHVPFMLKISTCSTARVEARATEQRQRSHLGGGMWTREPKTLRSAHREPGQKNAEEALGLRFDGNEWDFTGFHWELIGSNCDFMRITRT